MMVLKHENLLNKYPAFSFLNWMKKFNVYSIPIQNLILTIFFVILIFISSFIDNSIFLDQPNIGLFQHPSIWTFFLIQIIVPFALQKSTRSFLNMPQWKNSIIKDSFFNSEFKNEILRNEISRKTTFSKLIYIILFVIGLVCFIWNTYQNQLPLKFLGFDFWDSYNYPFGYWITRLYKLYMWCLFFPSIMHLYLFIIIKTLGIMKRSYTLKLFSIEPYHYDDNGGISIFLKNIINPIIPVLFSTSLLSIFVFLVHKKFDLTSISSLIIATSFLLIFYFIPAIYIRKIIKKDKERQLAKIAQKQEKLLNSIISTEALDQTKNNYELLNILVALSKQIKSIPNWPNYKFILKLLSLAYSPTVVNIIIKVVIPLFR